MVSEVTQVRSSTAVRRGLVLGCGGTLGAAWSCAALFEVSSALGWDPREAEVIYGTSAGASLAVLLAAGVSARALVDAQVGAEGCLGWLAEHFAAPPPALPVVPRAAFGAPRFVRLGGALGPVVALAGLLPEGRGDTAFLSALAERALPAQGLGRSRLVAVDARTGERVVFGGAGAPSATVADALRASWAIPGIYPPVAIGGRRYLDGGIVSPTSVDLAAREALDELVVIAPMATAPLERPTWATSVLAPLRASMRRTLEREISAAEAAGVRVIRIVPSEDDLRAIGANPMDGGRRLRVVEHALRSSRGTVRAALARHPQSKGAPSWSNA